VPHIRLMRHQGVVRQGTLRREEMCTTPAADGRIMGSAV
jgi:hypothetical protein